jgi:hypothetical protein
MTKSTLLLIMVIVISCTAKKTNIDGKKDNPLIKTLYQKDIEIRELDAKTDTVNLEAYDKKHREQIFQLLAENKLVTPKDKVRAAWILQHTAAKYCEGEITSLSPENFLLAYQLSSAALQQLTVQNDTATIRKENIPRVIALNLDRYLLYSFGYQKFGTQFVFDEATGEMLLAPVDTSLSSDEERRKFNVEPLDQLLSKYKMKPLLKK